MTEVTINPGPLTAAAANNGTPDHAQEEQTAVQNYTDGYTYEVPRPFLTLQQASQILGMTLRSLERSVLGRWGNKLPEGWVARRIKTQAGDEWRILPPPGFRVKMNASPAPGTECDTTFAEAEAMQDPAPNESLRQQENAPRTTNDPLAYYSGSKRKGQPWRPERHTLDQPTIVIDRTEEVEHLLRELLAAKSALAEERRLHMEDLRMITQLQGSMRLLEVNAAEQAKTRAELEAAKQELNIWREKYNRIMSLPWWRRMFWKKPD